METVILKSGLFVAGVIFIFQGIKIIKVRRSIDFLADEEDDQGELHGWEAIFNGIFLFIIGVVAVTGSIFADT